MALRRASVDKPQWAVGTADGAAVGEKEGTSVIGIRIVGEPPSLVGEATGEYVSSSPGVSVGAGVLAVGTVVLPEGVEGT